MGILILFKLVGRNMKFVLLTSQRTGSTLLVRSLDSSPQILCAGEMFHSGPGVHRPEFQYPAAFLGSYRLGRIRDAVVGRRRIHRHLASFYSVADDRIDAVGFKLMLSQARQYQSIMRTLRALGVRFLYLYREDSVATALSYCRARVTGVFHSDRMGQSRASANIVVSEQEFSRVLRRCRSDRDELIRLHAHLNGYLMRYEDMVADWEGFIEKVGNELGIRGLQVAKALSKMSLPDGSARIANEDALMTKFGSAIRSAGVVEVRGSFQRR